MTLITASPTQGQGQAWRDIRAGRFTASTIGKLMTEPRSLTAAQKEAKAKGVPAFGDTALQLIAVKAAERMAGVTDANPGSRSMDRGTILEHAAIHLLGRKWRAIDHATFMPLGANAGATPDGLTDKGEATLDIKCPESFADLLRFDLEVPDGDFAALEAWNKGYAWQIMAQAKAAGVTRAWLVYFTDRLPLHPLTHDERDEVQAVIDWHLERLAEGREYPFGYSYASQGFAYVARCFTLTPELSERIDRTLAAAEACLQDMLARTTMGAPVAPVDPEPKPTADQDEPTADEPAEDVEGAVAAVEAAAASKLQVVHMDNGPKDKPEPQPDAEAQDLGRLDQLAIMLGNCERDMRRLVDTLASPMARHGADHALRHMLDALSVLHGTRADMNPQPIAKP